jgi:peptide/nickel transport system permease protein
MAIQERRRLLAGPHEAQPFARRPTRSGFWARFRREPGALLGLSLTLLLVLTAFGAEYLAPGDPFSTSREVLQAPSRSHPFGTDDLGRDLFRAVIHGTRVSLLIGLVTAASAAILGLVVGGIAGYSGGLLDDLLMRLAELFQVIPRFFLALIVVALLGSSIWLIVLLLSLTYWPSTARLVRAQVLSLREREYVLAVRAMGARNSRILLRHVLPGTLPPVLVQAALLVGGAILVEAGLSFLGLGDRDVVSWGLLLNDAQQFVRQAWWMSAFPGAAITLTVLGLNLLADGLNEAAQPRRG